LDPNLIAQGIPIDDRVNPDARIYGPIEGTPSPPGMPPLPDDALTGDVPPPAPLPPEPDPTPSAIVAPSSYAGNEVDAVPSAAVASYNPRTGAYMASDGRLYRQSTLTTTTPKAWTDLIYQP
jgi:hypothetical protein